MCDRCSFPFVAKFVICDCETSLCEACAKHYGVYPAPQPEYVVDVYLPTPVQEEVVTPPAIDTKPYWYHQVSKDEYTIYQLSEGSFHLWGRGCYPLSRVAKIKDGKVVPIKKCGVHASIGPDSVTLIKCGQREYPGGPQKEIASHKLKKFSELPQFHSLVKDF